MTRGRGGPVVRVAIVGLGAIGREVLKAVQARPGLELVAVADPAEALVGRDAGEIAGVGGGCGQVVGPSIQADVVDYDERATGERKEGIYFAAWAFVRKSAFGVATMLATLPGLPSTAIPTGFSPDGLPVGVQIVGPWLEERTPLKLAELIEREFGGFVPPTTFDD